MIEKNKKYDTHTFGIHKHSLGFLGLGLALILNVDVFTELLDNNKAFDSYRKIDISQLQIQPMIWASTLQIRKHVNFGDLGIIILFVGILPFQAINLGVVSLFADSPFMFLAMFVSDVLYRFE